jgi:hypothetical protein
MRIKRKRKEAAVTRAATKAAAAPAAAPTVKTREKKTAH